MKDKIYAVDAQDGTANRLALVGFHEQLCGPRYYIISAGSEEEAIKIGKELESRRRNEIRPDG